MQSVTYRTVLLGSLLHDIGKFLQRGEFDVPTGSGKHPEWSGLFVKNWGKHIQQWIDLDLLFSIVSRHHESPSFPDHLLAQSAPENHRDLCLLVSRADNFSSAERSTGRGTGYFKTTPLTTVFHRLKLRQDTLTKPGYYHPSILDPANVFPTGNSTIDPALTTKLIHQFANKMETIGMTGWASFHALFTTIMTTLEEHCWWIPANTMEDLPDISLYDHLRTTAAIAACLYQYHERVNNFSHSSIADDSANKFLLLAGDLSGIQSYIFDIANIGAGGVAKRLRARSFFLAAIATALAHKVTKDLGLTPANILSMSGGNFYILLPNIPEARDYVSAMDRQINTELISLFGGELSLNLALVPFAGEDFKTYTNVIRQAGELLSIRKQNPLTGILIDQKGTWNEDAFLLETEVAGHLGYCRSCGKLPATVTMDEVHLCSLCQQDTRVGTWLPNTKMHIYHDRKPNSNRSIPLPGDLWVEFGKESHNDYSGSSDSVLVAFHLERASFPNGTLPLRRSVTQYYVPARDGQNLDFDTIAAQAKGRQLLGVYKADVDNLGALFLAGLGSNATISRVATLSRFLDLFFSGWLNILLQAKFPNVYLVYSGGDDVLAIGPWSEMADLAITVNQEFQRFVNYNPDITMSAGISVIKPSYPISLAAEKAEENLEKSKSVVLPEQQDAKNQCTFLGVTVKWHLLPALLAESKDLASWLTVDKVSTSFVRNLMYYSKLFNMYLYDHDIAGLKYLPLLSYDINRNIKPDRADVLKWVKGLMDINSQSVRYLAMIARYALLAKEGKNA